MRKVGISTEDHCIVQSFSLNERVSTASLISDFIIRKKKLSHQKKKSIFCCSGLTGMTLMLENAAFKGWKRYSALKYLCMCVYLYKCMKLFWSYLGHFLYRLLFIYLYIFVKESLGMQQRIGLAFFLEICPLGWGWMWLLPLVLRGL